MATIYNSDLSKEIRDVGKIQISRDNIPSRLGDTVLPVIDVNPKHARVVNKIFSGSLSATGGFSFSAGPKTLYLTGFNMEYTADVAADNTVIFLRVTVGGANVDFNIRKQTLTAGSDHLSQSFPVPIPIDRNSSIYCVSTFAAGACTYGCTLYGYYDEQELA